MLELHQLRPSYAEGVLTPTQGEKVKPVLASLAQRPEALDTLPDLTKLSPTAEALQDWAKEYGIALPDGEQHPFQLAVPFYDIIPVCPPRALEILDQLDVLIDDKQNRRDLIAFGDVMTALQIARDEAQEIESLKPIMAEADELIDTVFPALGAPKEPTEIIITYDNDPQFPDPHAAGYAGKLNGHHIIYMYQPFDVPSVSYNPYRDDLYGHPSFHGYEDNLRSFLEERAHQSHAEHVGQVATLYPIPRDESVATAEERPYSYRELLRIQRVNDSFSAAGLPFEPSHIIMKRALQESLANAVAIACMLYLAKDMESSGDRRRASKNAKRSLWALQDPQHQEYSFAFDIIHTAQRQGMSLQTLVNLILNADLTRFVGQSPETPEMQQLIANPSLLQDYIV